MPGGEPAVDRAALTAEGEVDGGNSAAHGASGKGSGGDSRRLRQMQCATVAEVARRGRGEGSARAYWRHQPAAETEATAATRTGEAEPTGVGAELSVAGAARTRSGLEAPACGKGGGTPARRDVAIHNGGSEAALRYRYTAVSGGAVSMASTSSMETRG